MEHDKKPISNAIALTPPEFTVTPQWAQSLGRIAKEKYGSLSRDVCEFTRYLVNEGETPLNLQDYSKIVSDLMSFGYADILEVVLAHIPPDLTKLVVTNNTTINLQAASTSTLRVQGGVANDFVITAGSI